MSHAIYLFKVILPQGSTVSDAKDTVRRACEGASDANNWYSLLEVHDCTSRTATNCHDDSTVEYHDEEFWDREAMKTVVFSLLSAVPEDVGGVSEFFTSPEEKDRVGAVADNVLARKELLYETAMNIGNVVLAQGPSGNSPEYSFQSVGYQLGKVVKALCMNPRYVPWQDGCTLGDFYDYRAFVINDIDDPDGPKNVFVVVCDIHT